MENIKKVVERYVELLNKHDLNEIRKLYHKDYTYTGSDGKLQKGPDAGIAAIDMYLKAFPDMKVEVNRMFSDGHTVISELTGSGTHKGMLMGMAPTGRTGRVLMCNILEVRDGKVAAEREYMDTAVMIRQLEGREDEDQHRRPAMA
jgi:steroid delta-isomerase-like uncharacterized protein